MKAQFKDSDDLSHQKCKGDFKVVNYKILYDAVLKVFQKRKKVIDGLKSR